MVVSSTRALHEESAAREAGSPGPCCLTRVGMPGSLTGQLNFCGFCQGGGWPSAALHEPVSWPLVTPPGGVSPEPGLTAPLCSVSS